MSRPRPCSIRSRIRWICANRSITSRAARVRRAMKSTGVGLSDLGYFDNMLVADPAVRARKHEFMLRVFDAAVLLGTAPSAASSGRNPDLEMDANLAMFEEEFVPLLQEAKARGLVYPGRAVSDAGVERRATPGTTTSLTHPGRGSPCIASASDMGSATSSASTTTPRMPSSWDRTRARSSNISRTGLRLSHRRLSRQGPGHRLQGGLGLGLWRPDPAARRWIGDEPAPRMPADQAQRLEEADRAGEHELPGTARHDPLAYLQNRSVDWLDHQLAARELLDIDAARDLPGGGARISAGPDAGQGTAGAHSRRLARLRAGDR